MTPEARKIKNDKIRNGMKESEGQSLASIFDRFQHDAPQDALIDPDGIAVDDLSPFPTECLSILSDEYLRKSEEIVEDK